MVASGALGSLGLFLSGLDWLDLRAFRGVALTPGVVGYGSRSVTALFSVSHFTRVYETCIL